MRRATDGGGPDPASLAVFALLADGRFPSGGHASSNGFEAVARLVPDPDAGLVDDYVRGRLATTGRTEAALVAAGVDRWHRHGELDWARADDEVEARLLGTVQRNTSRRLGRQWRRAGREIWRERFIEPAVAHADGPHQVTAVIAVALSAGLDASQATAAHLHHLVSGITTAAVRLLGLDPYAMQRCQLALGTEISAMVDEAVAGAGRAWSELPATTGPWVDLLLHDHAGWPMRLFQN